MGDSKNSIGYRAPEKRREVNNTVLRWQFLTAAVVLSLFERRRRQAKDERGMTFKRFERDGEI